MAYQPSIKAGRKRPGSVLLVAGYALAALVAGAQPTPQQDQNPAAQCGTIADRLKTDRNVTDATMLRCVETVAADRAAAEHYIDQLLPLLTGRDSLRAALLSRKASLALETGDFAKASAAFEAAWKAIEPVKLKTDLQRQKILVGLGQSLLSQKKNKEAEGYFLQAMSYPWFTVTQDPQTMQQLRDQYIQAARGLISSRRGDAAALREIFFVPAVEKDLKPLLDRAIQEASGAGR